MGFWVFGLVLGIGIGPRDEEDATVANNDANANANDGPKTSDMTQNNAHSAAQRDPIRSQPIPEAKSAASGEPTKYFTHTLCPKCSRARGLTRSMQLFAPF